MVKNCVVGGCNATDNNPGISFFRFPTGRGSECRRRAWVRFVKTTRKDFTGVGPGLSHSVHSRICSNHFHPSEFVEGNRILVEEFRKRKELKGTAIPTIRSSSSIEHTTRKVRRSSQLRERRKEAAQILLESEEKENGHRVKTESASEKLQHFATLIRSSMQHQRGLELAPNGPQATKSLNAITNNCDQAVQVYSQSLKKHYRSKATNVCWKCCGVDKVVQTSLPIATTTTDKSTHDAWTQWEDQGVRQSHIEEESEVMGLDTDMESHHDDDPKDLDYTPNHNPPDMDVRSFEEPVLPHVEMKYIVFESCILQLLCICPVCGQGTEGRRSYQKGTLVCFSQECVCGFKRQWHSQPLLGSIPAGNILLSSGILFSGGSPSKVIRTLESINVACISYSCFLEHQRRYLQPSITRVWQREQSKLVDVVRSEGSVTLGGDARNDSPGKTSKFASYTFMDLDRNKILHVELVQKNEVPNSYHMELEGLKRGIAALKEMEVKIRSLVTDRHPQVSAWIRKELVEKEELEHFFDVWHISKGLKKKLQAAGCKTGCQLLHQWMRSICNHLYWCASSTPTGDGDEMVAKWMSVVNHIFDIHNHESPLFPTCLHGPLPIEERNKAWVNPETKVADETIKILKSPYLIRSIRQMSPLHQTSSVESFHGVINHFSPKLLTYSFQSMLCRLFLACLHYNENAGRDQRIKRDGSLQWSVSFPRGRDGNYVLKRVLKQPTYDYVHNLMCEVTLLAATGDRNLRDDTPLLSDAPPPLAAAQEHPDIITAVKEHMSRFVN